jgi:hypothetical protein
MTTQSTTRKGFWGYVATLVLACTLLLLSEGRASAQGTVPADLNPTGNHEVLRAYGVGVQIYQSVASANDPTTFEWKFVAPEATLFTPGGQQIARHFAGPSWESNSGSLVVGALFKSDPAPDPNAIPWLLVNAVSHDGAGLFEHVSFIQRINTTGGKAPSAAPTQAGLVARVPYTATYVFFVPTGN